MFQELILVWEWDSPAHVFLALPEVTVQTDSYPGFVLLVHFQSLAPHHVRRALPVSFASRDAAAPMAQGFAPLAVSPLWAQAQPKAALLVLPESIALQVALPPAAVEAALLAVSPLSGLERRRVAVPALQDGTAWRVVQATRPTVLALLPLAAFVLLDHFPLLVLVQLELARFVPRIVSRQLLNVPSEHSMILIKVLVSFAMKHVGY